MPGWRSHTFQFWWCCSKMLYSWWCNRCWRKWTFYWHQSHKQWCLLHFQMPACELPQLVNLSTETSRHQSAEWPAEHQMHPANIYKPKNSSIIVKAQHAVSHSVHTAGTHMHTHAYILCEKKWNQVAKMHWFWRWSSTGVQVERLFLFVRVQNQIKFPVWKENASPQKRVRWLSRAFFNAGYQLTSYLLAPKLVCITIYIY